MIRQLFVMGLAVSLGACGGGDEPRTPSRFALRGRRVDVTGLTYAIEGRGAVELERACRRWSELGPAKLRAARPDELPDFVVSWERGTHGACTPFGADPSVAHTGPIDAETTFVHLDEGRAWDSADGPSLSRALMHELGHVLGLGHSPDPLALMYADPAVDGIAQPDRDALHTLYGGGRASASDLLVLRGGEELCVLYGIVTPGHAEFELFDTDGDGDDEVVVWRTDPGGSGEITAFHFAPGPLPERTVGPRLGMSDPHAAIDLQVTEAGERVLVLEYPNGNRIVRRFDEGGQLHGTDDEGLPPLPAIPERRLKGDLDGDGVPERVARRDS